MKNKLTEVIQGLCGADSKETINTLYDEGLLNSNSVRNYLIRLDFNNALKKNNSELIKNIFIDLSVEYSISIRQAQRIVYDYMKNKVSSNGNTINN
jgi:hypothetical protein|tara:strand:+ start:826 stop:1113 length:288 start_codon:yes stop_codon:yes gene_type:complete